MARKFDVGDEVYYVGKNELCATKYRIVKTHEQPKVDHYVHAERIYDFLLNSSTQTEFMVDENLKAFPLTRKVIFEKWKKIEKKYQSRF
jgi:hypothetical protein